MNKDTAGRRGEDAPATTRVTIYGRDFELASAESEAYTLEIAEYVDGKMNEIASALNQADPTKLAIMAAMEISNRLIRERERLEGIRSRASTAVERLGRSLDDTP